MYRVRVLAKEGEAAADARDVGAVVKERLVTARDARRAIGIPNANTDTYRCVCETTPQYCCSTYTLTCWYLTYIIHKSKRNESDKNGLFTL